MPSTAQRRVRETDLPPRIQSSEPSLNGGMPFVPPEPTAEEARSSILDRDIPKSKAETDAIVKALEVTYTHLALGVSLVAPADGIIVGQNASELAESWRRALDNDAKLRKRMKTLIQGSAMSEVIKAHLVVAMAIAGNHRDRLSHLVRRKTTPES